MSFENTKSRPDPAEFDDYRVFLRTMVAHLKATQRGFSYRNFARKAGYASPNFLKLVAEGKRNLSSRSINRFAQGLGLSAKEHEAFESLVMLGQARTDAERNRYYLLLRSRQGPRTPRVEIEMAQYDLYTLWYALPVREMLLLPDFREDPVWIAKRFRPPIRPANAERALDLLEQTGLAVRDKDGRLQPASVKLTTPPTVASLAVRNYHRSMLDKAAESLDGIPVDERNITSLTAILTSEQYTHVCDRIREFRKELLDEIEDLPRADGKRDVHVVGFQVFPLTGEDQP